MADYDQTHRFNFNSIYDLPFGRGKRFFGDAGGFADRWALILGSGATRQLDASLAKMKQDGDEGSFLEIFSPPLLSTTLRASLLATGMKGAYYAVTTWLPTYLSTERQLSVLNTSGYLLVLILGSFLGVLVVAPSRRRRPCQSLTRRPWRRSRARGRCPTDPRMRFGSHC